MFHWFGKKEPPANKARSTPDLSLANAKFVTPPQTPVRPVLINRPVERRERNERTHSATRSIEGSDSEHESERNRNVIIPRILFRHPNERWTTQLTAMDKPLKPSELNSFRDYDGEQPFEAYLEVFNLTLSALGLSACHGFQILSLKLINRARRVYEQLDKNLIYDFQSLQNALKEGLNTKATRLIAQYSLHSKMRDDEKLHQFEARVRETVDKAYPEFNSAHRELLYVNTFMVGIRSELQEKIGLKKLKNVAQALDFAEHVETVYKLTGDHIGEKISKMNEMLKVNLIDAEQRNYQYESEYEQDNASYERNNEGFERPNFQTNFSNWRGRRNSDRCTYDRGNEEYSDNTQFDQNIIHDQIDGNFRDNDYPHEDYGDEYNSDCKGDYHDDDHTDYDRYLSDHGNENHDDYDDSALNDTIDNQNDHDEVQDQEEEEYYDDKEGNSRRVYPGQIYSVFAIVCIISLLIPSVQSMYHQNNSLIDFIHPKESAQRNHKFYLTTEREFNVCLTETVEEIADSQNMVTEFFSIQFCKIYHSNFSFVVCILLLISKLVKNCWKILKDTTMKIISLSASILSSLRTNLIEHSLSYVILMFLTALPTADATNPYFEIESRNILSKIALPLTTFACIVSFVWYYQSSYANDSTPGKGLEHIPPTTETDKVKTDSLCAEGKMKNEKGSHSEVKCTIGSRETVCENINAENIISKNESKLSKDIPIEQERIPTNYKQSGIRSPQRQKNPRKWYTNNPEKRKMPVNNWQKTGPDRHFDKNKPNNFQPGQDANNTFASRYFPRQNLNQRSQNNHEIRKPIHFIEVKKHNVKRTTETTPTVEDMGQNRPRNRQQECSSEHTPPPASPNPIGSRLLPADSDSDDGSVELYARI